MKHAATIVVAVVPILLLGACDPGGPGAEKAAGPQRVAPGAEAAPLDPAEFVGGVAHPYWPMVPGARWMYEGAGPEGARREIVTVEPHTRILLGVACTVVVQEVFEDGAPVELTTHWFAEDRAGDVWRFGELSLDLTGPAPVETDDSWEAGVDGVPWIVLGADPRPGDAYLGLHPGGTDRIDVVAVGVAESVPAGTFEECLQAAEVDPEDPTDVDLVIYAPGVGPISETSADTRLELVAGP